MRRLARIVRFLFVRHRALTFTTIVFLSSIALAFANGYWIMARTANMMLLLIPLAFLWSRINLRGLEVSVQRPVDRLQEGGYFEERITVTNRSWFTKLWLEVEDTSELPGHDARRIIGLGARSTRSFRTVSRCERRGLFSMGPVRVTSGDPFGLFRVSRHYGEPQHVLVYPRALDLPNFSVPPAHLPGEGRFRRPTNAVTPNASGVRDYRPGDSLNRIHWRSTARTRELMVKLFELDPSSDIWVVLDLHGPAQAGEGDDGTEEHAVRIAASVARFFLTASRNVGFMAYGKRFHIEEPERGVSQYTRILEALALARAEGDVPLGDLLNHESRRFGRHTTVVVITPSTDESWVVSLQMLTGRGVKLAAIVLEPRTYGGERDALFVYGALTASDVQTYLVKRRDDLSVVLSASGHPAPVGRGSA
ncbi:MAG: DUF58 domain-containing protein [Dehalococcoidia bacterium]